VSHKMRRGHSSEIRRLREARIVAALESLVEEIRPPTPNEVGDFLGEPNLPNRNTLRIQRFSMKKNWYARKPIVRTPWNETLYAYRIVSVEAALDVDEALQARDRTALKSAVMDQLYAWIVH
jgi:hypothetical protein